VKEQAQSATIIPSLVLPSEKVRSLSSLYSYSIGAFGEVRRAIHLQTNVTRAVKIIKKSLTCPEQQEMLINEFNILKMIVSRQLFIIL